MIRFLILLALLVACEGPMGPQGPQGEQGPLADGRIAVTLIEERLARGGWKNEQGDNVYYLYDDRMRPETVVEVYIKEFYETTGKASYIDFTEWTKAKDFHATYHIDYGNVHFHDPYLILRDQLVAIAVINVVDD